VQTLTFDSTSLVFFAVDADTATPEGDFDPTDIGGTFPAFDDSAIGLGELHLTEAELEAGAASPIGDGTFPFIREEIEMNVSTTGIGVGNNVFQGYDPLGGTDGAIDPFNPDDLPEFDESFVINPEPLASSVKVFISKTAGGFLPPFEDGVPQEGATAAKTDYLYFNVYDELGNSIGPILVTSDMVVDESDVAAGGTGENLWSFTVDIVDLTLSEELTGNFIDAIQFTMGFGDIKIPKIEVVVRGDEPPNDIFLDFSATLTDADGDSATTDFAIDLYGNNVISESQFFDYTLVDAGDPNGDAFNVDLTSELTEYLVTGFDNATDDDKLLLLGDADAAVAIDNSDNDSIVTVTESGAEGQTTTVTVVGVDLTQGDDVILVSDGEEDLLLLHDLENANNLETDNFYDIDSVFNGSRMSSDFEPIDLNVEDGKLITLDYITSEDTLI
jgi:hypothetical protein